MNKMEEESASSTHMEDVDNEPLLSALLQETIFITEDEDFTKNRMKHVVHLWSKQDELLHYEEDKSMRTVTVDLEALTETSGYISKASKGLKAGDLAFNIVEFGNIIRSDYVDKHYEILQGALPLMNAFNGFDPLLGIFNQDGLSDTLPEVKKRKRRVEKDVLEEKKTPKEIENTDDKDLDISVKVRHVLKCLKNGYRENNNSPINFYKLILHPNCFATSVENLYTTSFLIKDSVAKIEMIDGQMMISPIIKDKRNSEGIKKSQVVMGLTIDTWKKYVQQLDITTPMILCD